MILDDLINRARNPNLWEGRFRGAVLLNAQQAHDLMWRQPDKAWGDNSFPNVAPPWREFAVFWSNTHPPSYVSRTTVAECVYVRAERLPDEMSPARWLLREWYLTDFNCLERPLYAIRVRVIDNDGIVMTGDLPPGIPDLDEIAKSLCHEVWPKETSIIDEGSRKRFPGAGRRGLVLLARHGEQETLGLWQRGARDVYLMALSLCHCKNVTADPVALPSAMVRARARRAKRPFLRYHVLQIEPMRRALREEGGPSTGLKQALHICRGHFKTYRDGRALFGKYTGTYWWEDAVRGSRVNGEVVKSYSVKEAASCSTTTAHPRP